MHDNVSWLIAGLGNPGRKYTKTRHNAGFMLIDRIAEKNGIRLDGKRFKNLYGTGKISDTRVILAQPMDYMNRSGPPISQLAGYFRVSADHILIIHDDVDIEKGRIKIKSKGGHGGHNGIKSIIDALGTREFPRIRIGIGRPEPPVDVTDYVLGKFSPEEFLIFEPVLQTAMDAVETILDRGTTAAMNQFN